jgi:pimeloyl-ACP methyl ester carboxylesterase
VTDLNANIKKHQALMDTTNVFKGSNAVIITGEADPWRKLQVNATIDSTSVVYQAGGVGHSAALQPPTTSDVNDLSSARTLISKNVNSWLSGGPTITSTSNLAAKTANNRVEAEKQRQQDDTEEEMRVKWPTPKNLLSQLVDEAPIQPAIPEGKAPLKSAPRRRHFSSPYVRQMEARRNKVGVQPNALNSTTNNYLWTGWCIQAVDHFNVSDTRTWKQKYFTNNKNVETHHAPQFLMLGGETSIDFTYVSGEFLQYVQWAKDFNAMLHALEHRFYGDSQPFNYDTSTENLVYLTNENVLGDIATYITTTNAVKNLTVNRWIVFGGSYSGSLVAMFRVRYPDLSIGGIASSAPIQAVGDFYSYIQDVSYAVDAYGIDGCGEGIRRFFYELRRLFNTRDGRLIVKADFCIWNDWYVENYIDEKDAEYFLAEYVFLVSEFVQYDDEDHWYLQYLCEFFREFWSFGTDNSKGLVQALILLSEDLRGNSTDPRLQGIHATVQDRVEHRKQLDAKIKAAVSPKDIRHRIKLDKAGRPIDPFTRAVDRHQRFKKGWEVKPDDYSNKKGLKVKPDDGGDYSNYDDQSDYNQDYDTKEGSNWDGSTSLGDDDESLVCYCWGCWYVSYDETLWILQLTTYDFWDWVWWRYGDDRIWMFQTCTMWGYQISTDYGRNIFEDSLPINFLIDYCPDIFGDDYNRSRLDGGVRDTNWRYGGQDNYNGTNVVFVNGSEDPWHMLSLYAPDHMPIQGDNGNVTLMLIPGTSHCQDMYKWEAGDVDVVKVAHKKIKAILVDWVSNSKPPAN